MCTGASTRFRPNLAPVGGVDRMDCGGHPSAWSDKLNWVKMHLSDRFTKKLILCHHKELLSGDYLIDDNSKNGAEDFRGKWIHFGSPEFPDWAAVEKYLFSEQ